MTDAQATAPGLETRSAFLPAEARPVMWRVERDPVPYARALEVMEARVDAIRRGTAPELAWLVEHPPLYTAGTAAGVDLPPTPLPLHRTGRGGQVTYHGPGQRVVYLMLDLDTRSRDVRAFVGALEDWIIAALAALGVVGERRADRVGVWVSRPDKPPGPGGASAEDKIAALGIRIRRWVTFHGISLNVDPDLGRFRAITPCGIADAHLGVTSLAALGRPCRLADADAALHAAFEPIFGRTVPD